MSFSLVYDLIFVALAIIIVLRCWHSGLVASVIRLVGTLAAYIGAWVLASPASQFLYDRLLHDWLVDYAQQRIPDQLGSLAGSAGGLVESLGLDKASAMLREYLEPLLESLPMGGGLPFFQPDSDTLSRNLIGLVVDDRLSLAEALVESLLRPGVTLLLQIACFAVLFGFFSMAVHLLIRMARGVNHVPLVGGVNRLLGGVIGLLEAALVVYLLCLVLVLASALLGSTVSALDWQTVYGSRVVQIALGAKLPATFSFLP